MKEAIAIPFLYARPVLNSLMCSATYLVKLVKLIKSKNYKRQCIAGYRLMME